MPPFENDDDDFSGGDIDGDGGGEIVLYFTEVNTLQQKLAVCINLARR